MHPPGPKTIDAVPKPGAAVCAEEPLRVSVERRRPAEVLHRERDAQSTHLGHGYLSQHRIGCEIPQGPPGQGSRPRRTRPRRRRRSYALLAMNPWPWPELSE
jgi:hypothetical protein